MIIKYSLLILIIFLVGCSKEQAIIEEVAEIQPTFKETSIQLYINEQLDLAVYEPAEGVYLGVYSQDIDYFENTLDTEMAFRVMQYTVNDPVTSIDILDCIANQQLPYVKYLFDDTEPITSLYYLIGDISTTSTRYSTPIFIELYPLTQNVTNPIEYKEKFQEAYQIIKKYIPEAVIVWSLDYSEIEDIYMFYPGDDVVDWVGLNIYMYKYFDNELVDYDISDNIDLWYKTFQSTKPLMITGLGISSFSQIDHTYYIADAKNKLKYFYEEMLDCYPRIKGILYSDVDMRKVGGVDDFRISIDFDIIDYVSNLWQNERFLTQVTVSGDESMQYISYTLPAYIYDEMYYIEDIYLQTIIPPNITKSIDSIKDLEGTIYYNIDDILVYIDGYYRT
ncbi:MAG: hypothetical protein ATN35_10885 [Epulopiscium sp. Nele67-Bin004]|nr:MAG: hypothetical protein ATN35_10885 [Epulopiscium sp. Nele67-Bin004]